MSNSTKARVVFVLDVSGSMSDKIDTLNIAVSSFISDYPIGQYVGIVLFSSTSWIEHEVIEINDTNSRSSLLSKVPKRLYGATDIGAGLVTALTALTNVRLLTEGAILLLVTDGYHNTGPPYVEFSLQKLKNAKVIVNCIAYGNEADINLEKVTSETGGKIFKADDKNKEMALRTIEACMRETAPTKEINESRLITVVDDIIKIESKSFVKSVIIDSNIGRNTTFTFNSTEFEKFSVSLTSPTSKKYDSNSIEFNKISYAKKYQFDFKTAETGKWDMAIDTQSNMSISANIRVTSRSLNSNAIKINAFLHNPSITENLPSLIFVEFEKLKEEIKRLEVTATIEKPNRTQVTIKLTKLDQVYWAYFSDYSEKGRYNVTVMAKSLETNKLMQFERQEVAGCLKVMDFVTWSAINNYKVEELVRTKNYKLKK